MVAWRDVVEILRACIEPDAARPVIAAGPQGSGRAMSRGQPWLRALGVGLTLSGVIFTGRIILQNDALAQLSWDARLCASLVLACGAYALLSVLLVLVWAAMLDAFAPGRIGAREAYALYAITQIMKYLPSNVVHFVGRHLALHRRGVSHLALLSTVAGEAAVLACGACLAALALRADVLTALFGRHVQIESLPVIVAAGLALCLGATLVWRRCAWLRRLAAAGMHRRLAPRLMIAVSAAAVFFASTTVIVAMLCRLLLDHPAGFSTPAVAATLAGAWLVGFVIPGASAGIGVREAAVILLLSPAVGAGDAAVIAAIYRIVTAGGDALFAGLGELVRRCGAAPAPQSR
jgi:hypothetical protein